VEKLYISAMIKKELGLPEEGRSFASKFTELIARSHVYLREIEGESGTVSLRDVARYEEGVR